MIYFYLIGFMATFAFFFHKVSKAEAFCIGLLWPPIVAYLAYDYFSKEV